jgi:hypothetical protein
MLKIVAQKPGKVTQIDEERTRLAFPDPYRARYQLMKA